MVFNATRNGKAILKALLPEARNYRLESRKPQPDRPFDAQLQTFRGNGFTTDVWSAMFAKTFRFWVQRPSTPELDGNVPRHSRSP